MAKFQVSHRGVVGVETIEAANEEAAIESFREKHGKIETVHEYTVEEVGQPETTEPVTQLPADPPARTESDAPEASVIDTPLADPTLADLGIDGEAAELLTENGLTTRSKIVAFAQRHDGLTIIKGIGPATEREIREAVQASE